MYLSNITVRNFRLLKDFSVDLEKELSLIIGKNNSGKTSLLYILDKVFHWKDKGGCIHIDDFNLDYKKSLVDMLANDDIITEDDYQEDGVRLRLYIKYNDNDDLSNVGLIMMDLDENNYYVVLGYDYVLPYEAYCRLREKAKANAEKHRTEIREEVENLLDKSIANYFVLRRKSIFYDSTTNQINESNYIDLKNRPQFHEDALISIGYIDAKRQVANKENDKTLSLQTAELFNQLQSDDNEVLDNFIQTISESDKKLGEVYGEMFSSVLGKVEEMGGVKPKETKLMVTSSLKGQNLLKGNTKVVYEHTGVQLPEDHNGLGYMNLISMIFQIEIIRQTFMKGRHGKMADINLLIIEEPEAHTHPQMQYIFIKNIKRLLSSPLETNHEYRKIQSIISTHSSHIVSESEFGDIKYMRRTGNEVIAKNLKDLQNEYGNDEQKWYTFLKHYLTLSRSELFFADKAIFIEGDTERILLPILMKKLDQEELCDEDKNELPLCKQNISIIEVGAYSHIFGKFINFIGLEKAVVFTDLDVGHKTNGKGHITKTKYYAGSDEMLTTNNALKEYFKNLKDGNDLKVNKLLSLIDNQKVFTWNAAESQWKQDENGNMRVCFQVKESNYQARTFEDNFFAINKDFLQNNKDTIRGLDEEKLKDFLDTTKEMDVYDFAETGIESKATFAVEIIFNSKKDGDKEFCGWSIPKYIKDGLLWIRK